MKKLLALVLALVMTLSLCVVSSNAAYDGEEFDYDEAVEVMSAVGVFQGDENGKFNGKDVLTREQAAKIVTYMLLGKKAADALVTIAAPFADVAADRWSAGSIAYCYNEGILAGVGEGKFDPAGQLTGLAFAKMMLCALGYDAEIEALTGASWSINVAKLALVAGLTDGMDEVSLSAAMTREQAANMALNTMKARLVDYSSKIDVQTGDSTVTVSGGRYDVTTGGTYRIEGADVDGHNYCEFAEKYFKDLYTYESADDFGRPITEWWLSNEKVGEYTANTLVETITKKVTKASFYNVLGKAVYDSLYDGYSTLRVYVHGVRQDAYRVDDDTVRYNSRVESYADKNDSSKDFGSGNGFVTEVYIDDDKNVTVVCFSYGIAQATEDYNAKTESVKITGVGDCDGVGVVTVDLDDVAGIEDIKEDDYLLFTYVTNGRNIEIKSLEKAEVVTGTVEKFTRSDSVTVDGTTYSYSVNTLDTDGVQDIVDAVNGKVSLVLDKFGYVIAIDDATGTANFVYIRAAAAKSDLNTTVYADAFFTDGTEEEIVLKKVDNSTSSEDLLDAVGWYTYSKNAEGKYTLYALNGVTYTTYAENEVEDGNDEEVVTNGTAAIFDGSIKANNDTLFFVVDEDGDITTYTGIKKVPTIEAASGSQIDAVYKVSNDYAKYVMIYMKDVGGDIDDASSSDEFIFVTKLDSTQVDGDNTTYVYKAVVNGEETKITCEDQYDTMALYTKVKKDADGVVTDMTLVEESGDPVDEVAVAELVEETFGYSGGVLTVDDTNFTFENDVKVVLVLDYKQGTDNEDEDVHALLDDAGNKYEVQTLTAKQLANVLKDVAVSGVLYTVADDDYDESTNLTAMFVYVDAAEVVDD